VIPAEAVEAAAKALNSDFTNQWEKLPEWIRADIRRETAAALEAAAPHMLNLAKREAWDEAYDQGVDDERTSQANPGIAGCFCHTWPCQCFIAPARANPYRPTP
jgi:hypothetical protein